MTTNGKSRMRWLHAVVVTIVLLLEHILCLQYSSTYSETVMPLRRGIAAGLLAASKGLLLTSDLRNTQRWCESPEIGAWKTWGQVSYHQGLIGACQP